MSGRLYPVEVRYRPVADEDDTDDRTLMDAIVDAVDELAGVGRGDVLVFLPGEREIREAAEALRKHHPPRTEILPLFARLSVEEQERVFKPGGRGGASCSPPTWRRPRSPCPASATWSTPGWRA